MKKNIDNHSRSISLCKAQYQWHQHNISTSAYHYNQTLKTCYLGHLNGVSPVGELTDNINVFTSSYDFETGKFQKKFFFGFWKFCNGKTFYIYKLPLVPHVLIFGNWRIYDLSLSPQTSISAGALLGHILTYPTYHGTTLK